MLVKRLTKLWWVWGLAATVVGLTMLWGWRQRTPTLDVATLTQAVELREITTRITASGTVAPIQSVNLSPTTAGLVKRLFVEQGDRVEQGQVIARMDSADLEAQLVQAQASQIEAEAQLADLQGGSEAPQIAQAQANVTAVQAQLTDAIARQDLARSNRDRDQQLLRQGALDEQTQARSETELRSATAAVEQTQARLIEAEQRLADLTDAPDPEALAQAEARIQRAIGQVQAIQSRLTDTIIRAPFSGIITQKFATEGAFVTPTTSASTASSATSSAIVALASGLEVVAEIPEADLGQVALEQAVEIQADAFPEQTFEGRVRLIAPEAIEQQNVTVFQVRVRLLSGQDQLRSNMNVTVAFLGNRQENALVIPAVAVITQGGETGVLVPGERQQIVFRPVSLGPQVGDQIQVTDGLSPQDRVFVDLPPGQTLDNLRFSRDRNEN